MTSSPPPSSPPLLTPVWDVTHAVRGGGPLVATLDTKTMTLAVRMETRDGDEEDAVRTFFHVDVRSVLHEANALHFVHRTPDGLRLKANSHGEYTGVHPVRVSGGKRTYYAQYGRTVVGRDYEGAGEAAEARAVHMANKKKPRQEEDKDDDDDDVQVTGTRTREERDAYGRQHAVELE